MAGRRKKAPKALSSDSSDDDEPLAKKIAKLKKTKVSTFKGDDTSSDSDIGTYLQPIHKLDFTSPFFNLENDKKSHGYDKIEKSILDDVNRLTDSNSDDEQLDDEINLNSSTTKVNFSQLEEYTKKLEETRRHVEEYNARKQAETKQLNIENLLAAGETKSNFIDHEDNGFESSDTEKDDWEEVEDKKKKEKKKEKPTSEGLEIVVNMPTAVKKKKDVDLLLAIKRRINRIRKENQVLIHKVHLLCWIAHGNYLNSIMNSQNILALSLSLLPSKQCYPKNRTDLNYLTSLLKWYEKTMTYKEKAIPENKKTEELLIEQISTKTVYNKKYLVYIFLSILRSLGIQSRLVLSFQVEPLRPPSSELHSLSTKAGSSEASKKFKKLNKNSSDKPMEKEDIIKNKASKNLNDTTKLNPSDKNKEKKEIVSKKTSKYFTTKLNNSPDKNTEKKDIVMKKTDSTPKNLDRTIKLSNSNVEKRIADKKSISNTKLENIKEEKTKKSSIKDTKSKNLKDNEKNELSKNLKSRSSTSSKRKSTPSKKSTNQNENKNDSNTNSKHDTRSKSIKSKIPQLDGVFDDDDFLILQLDGNNDSSSPSKTNLKKLRSSNHKNDPSLPSKPKLRKLLSSDNKTKNKYKDSSTSEDDFAPAKNVKDSSSVKNTRLKKTSDVKDDIIKIMKSRIKEQKDVKRQKTTKRKIEVDSEEDSDYIPEELPKRKKDSEDDFVPKTKVKKRLQTAQSTAKKQGRDVWIEVFLEMEEKWISVDVTKVVVHCIKELCTAATHPISYVVAWDNNNKIKDITMRYCPNFNTVTRKLRADSKWWSDTLKPYIGIKNVRDKEEDDELERQQIEKPLPTSISEFKNHPLYVLKRHLLKFEALYPPDTPSIGFVRNEAVYPRDCVYTLHSREIWMKHAKVVKLAEQPYKIVKARPKWDKLSSKVITDQNLEIFGPWQTEDYDPPTAENGIVPRNAFGNVELFKDCMLPKKTVHLKLPGLNKVAKKLNIDCAAAIVGFDFHGGWNHPTYDGFVVCEEFADVLTAAWEEEQEEIVKREREKIDKRVYGNWKKLIRGLLIREKLKLKYEFGDVSTSEAEKKAKTKSGAKLSKNKSRIESDSE